MAPVVNIPVSSKGQPEKPKKPSERRPELFCRVKYCNTLPDIPFDPKFIVYPFETNRFVQYKQTSLEKNYKHDLLTEQDLGVTIDLINPETYEAQEFDSTQVTEEDFALLEDEVLQPTNTKRSRCHNRTVTWLKKTEYISTEFNRYGASSEKTETKVGFGVKKKMNNEKQEYVDRESQILAINKTFEAAKKPITCHPGKPGVKPVEVVPVFPDAELWKYPFAQVMFDTDPAEPDREEEMAEAYLRGQHEETEHFVGYFLPTEDTMNKRKIDKLEGRDYIYEEKYEYTNIREFEWIVKNRNTEKNYIENYFFVMRDNEVAYNELDARVLLKKRRAKQSIPHSTILAIKHRDFNDQEIAQFQQRLEKLEPAVYEHEVQIHRPMTSSSRTEVRDSTNREDEKSTNKNGKEESNSEAEESDKSEKSDSDSESEAEPKKPPTKRQKVKSQSDSDKSSSSSASSSSSESDSEDEKKSSSSSASSDDSDDDRQKRRQVTADIFGSDSD